MWPDCVWMCGKCSPCEERVTYEWWISRFITFLQCYATVTVILQSVWLFGRQPRHRACDMTVNMLMQGCCCKSLSELHSVKIMKSFFYLLCSTVQYVVGAKMDNHWALYFQYVVLCLYTALHIWLEWNVGHTPLCWNNW